MDDLLNTGVRKALNSHGHAFHQSVVRRLDTMNLGGLSPFRFVVAEFPVTTGGHAGAIDFILDNQRRPQLVVAECKRADPKLARWVFVRTPYTRAGQNTQGAFISAVYAPRTGLVVEETHQVVNVDPYHLVFEMKTGDASSGVGRVFDEAAKQAFVAASGLMQFLKHDWRLLLQPEMSTPIVPVIFTTAALFTVEDDISEAPPTTGELNEVHTKPVPWAWYQTNVSSDLRATGLQRGYTATEPRTLEAMVVHRFTRAVLVVSLTDVDNLQRFVQFVDQFRYIKP